MSGKKTNKTSSIVMAIVILTIAGFCVYANSLSGEFVLDDNLLIENNMYIKNPAKILHIFTVNIGEGAGRHYNLYRPLQMLSYMADYSIWKLNVRGYHLTNIFLHILAGLALFWLVSILYKNWLLSVLTGLLFITHPIHTEAVSYISGRADSLAALFMFLSFVFYIKIFSSGSKINYIPMILSFMAALLSRENSLVLILLLLLYNYTFSVKKISNYIPFFCLGTIALGYIIFRQTVLSNILPDVVSDTTFWQRLPGFFAAITNYTRLLLVPVNLHMQYGSPLFSYSDPKVWTGLIILCVLITAVIRLKGSRSIIFFSLTWFLISILPHSNLYPLNAYMAEHWLYIPSVGFFLILANCLLLMYKSKRFKYISIAIVTAVLTTNAGLTIRQNKYWRDPVSFYTGTLRFSPDGAGMYNNLAGVYSAKGEYQQAITAYKKAIELKPGYGEAYSNLATIYFDMGKHGEALDLFHKAIGIDPGHAGSYSNIGKAYNALGRHEEAIVSYKKALEINPLSAPVYNGLGFVYYTLKKNQLAMTAYRKAIELKSDLVEAYNNLGNIYYRLGNYKEAATLYKKAIQFNPYFSDAYLNLGLAYYMLDEAEKSVISLKKAIEMNPSNKKACYNLAVIYFEGKDYGQAVKYCDKAQALGYANPAFLENLKPYR